MSSRRLWPAKRGKKQNTHDLEKSVSSPNDSEVRGADDVSELATSSPTNSIFKNKDDSEDSSVESLFDPDAPQFSKTNLDESKAILHTMIDTCLELDEKQGFQAEEDKALRQQVNQSALLFETQIMPGSRVTERARSDWRKSVSRTGSDRSQTETPSSTKSQSEKQDKTASSRRKERNCTSSGSTLNASSEMVKPSYMFLAYRHTNLCAQLMRKRTEMMGFEESVISVEGYIEGLKKLVSNSTEEGSLAVKLWKLLSPCWKTAPSLPTLVGSFDYKEFLAKENILVEKPVKKEAKKRAQQFNQDSLIATQEKITTSKKDSTEKSKANDEGVRVFRKKLYEFSEQKPVNMLEFALHKDLVRESLNNMFGVAFGVRDGTIELTKDVGLLKIAPCNAPAQGMDKMSSRRQCIASFSAATIRKLQAIAEGETVLPTGTAQHRDIPATVSVAREP